MLTIARSALSCVAILFCASPAQAATQCKIVNTPDGFVALRSAPSAQSRLIVRMRAGDEVEIVSSRRDPWFEVRRWRGLIPYDRSSPYPISRGYMHKRYLRDCDI